MVQKNWFTTQETVQIDLDGGFWVKVKKHLSAADYDLLISKLATTTVVPQNRAERRANKGKDTQSDGVESETIVTNSIVALLTISIVEWNLTDGNGIVPPVNEANVSKLPVSEAEYISRKIDDLHPLGLAMGRKSPLST